MTHEESILKHIDIMNYYHPRWNEFCDRLIEDGFCKFKKNEEGKMVLDSINWPDIDIATNILKTMPEIDIETSIKYFRYYIIIAHDKFVLNNDPIELKRRKYYK